MLLPGCILLLVLSHDQPASILWSGYFGTDCDTGVKVTVLLVAGYVVGMLVHEGGDITEKALWSVPWIDPKTYAAKSVGEDKIYACLGEDQRMVQAQNTRITWKTIVAFLVFATVVIGVFLFVWVKDRRIGLLFWLSIFVGLIFVTWFRKNNRATTNTNDPVAIIRASNPMIQSRLVEQGNFRKRLVFDGFHVMMRNLLIVLALLQFYVYFFSEHDGALYKLLNDCTQYTGIYILGIGMICLMFVRYYHYSYLKYKYSFEDYILMRTAQQAPSREEEATCS